MNTNDMIILTRDCHGYQYYESSYNSPTIGNCMRIPDFICFLENINIVPILQLHFDENEKVKYPIGLLKIPDTNEIIRVHFLHDKNQSDILNKWNRRVERMERDLSLQKYVFLNDCDMRETNNNLTYYISRYFSISYGVKVFFCRKVTFEKLHLSDNIQKKGIIVIIPDSCMTGPCIYGYINSNPDIKSRIFLNEGPFSNKYFIDQIES